MRQPKIYEKKLSAHTGLVLTIDWHSDGRYLASGGRDKVIKIWDMQSESRKPIHYIQTMASLARIQWRPVLAGLETGKNFIASCSLVSDNRIHVWDIERPGVPYYTFEDHSNVITGLLWHDTETIYSVAKDEKLIVNRMDGIGRDGTGFRPTDDMSCTSVCWNASDELLFSNKSIPLNSISTTLASPMEEKTMGFNNTVSSLTTSPAIRYLNSDPVQMTWAGSSVSPALSQLVSMPLDEAFLASEKTRSEVGTSEEAEYLLPYILSSIIF